MDTAFSSRRSRPDTENRSKQRYEPAGPKTTSPGHQQSASVCLQKTSRVVRMVERNAGGSVADSAAAVVTRLADKLDEVTARTQAVLMDEVSDLRGDAQLVQLMRDNVAANIDTVFSAIRHSIPVEHVEAPTAALEYARRLAQRDVSANALVRAYRIGHQEVLRILLEEIRASELDSKLRLDVFDEILAVTFRYIDWISQQVLTVYQDEYEWWQQSRNQLRSAEVRSVLEGDGDVDIDAASAALGYPLRWSHVALVLSCEDSGDHDELAVMERFVHECATVAGACDRALFIPADRLTGWAWIPLENNHIAPLPDTVDSRISIAAGRSLPGVEGFRRSHRQAQLVRAVMTAADAGPGRAVSAGEPGLMLAGLAGTDLDQARIWVREVLGPLASVDARDERLRDTLRVFLRAGSSFTAAAGELHLHFNSVKYRVARAIERRGRPITDDALDVEVALLLCHWYGDAVLVS
ncbi:MAG: helix-turn-helix domain-containing protein [Mycobacterium sp.]|nr:helix-turn-helix domain-containing protein [Mycobacterium sp.]